MRLNNSLWPIALASFFILGFVFNSMFFNNEGSTSSNPFIQNKNKLNQILDYVGSDYVDSTDKKLIIESVIKGFLAKLDPHSSYIPSNHTETMNAPLNGNFSGIGVEFGIRKDTLVVIKAMRNGPGDKAGLLPSDRVILVDGEEVEKGIDNTYIYNRFRGEKGSIVNLGVQRRGHSKLLSFSVVRDEIPISSIDFSTIYHDTTGYMKIRMFSKETYNEFQKIYRGFLEKGVNKLVLDLRNNGGGYMNAAVKMADQFLEKDQLIMYTEGRSRPREEFRSTSNNDLRDIGLVVLINEYSASASEIFAGAIQDNDRGVIIGRRSFGKGLIQEQVEWMDGSATRLTIARYYTPSGRCIQKPYDNGLNAYNNEIYLRDNDSVSLNETPTNKYWREFKTVNGRSVFGGGGITPDVKLDYDTIGKTHLLSEIYFSGLFYLFSFDYLDQNRSKFNYETAKKYIEEFKFDDSIEKEFKDYLISHNLTIDEKQFKKSRCLIGARIRAGIGQNIFGDTAYYPIIHKMDQHIKQALATGPVQILLFNNRKSGT